MSVPSGWVTVVLVVVAVAVGCVSGGGREATLEALEGYGLERAPVGPQVLRDPVGEIVAVWYADGRLECRRDPELVVRLLMLRQQSMVMGMRKELAMLRKAVRDGSAATGE